jgi:two-component system chemotaxis response regulator CheB
MKRPVKVLVVDDSAVARALLSNHLARDPALTVVGTAPDPYVAWQKIRTLEPDVLTLDVEMPRMDGVTFLEKLMRRHPLAVVLVSSLTEAGCGTTRRALELGAVDFVTKPSVGLRETFPDLARELTEKVKVAAVARLRRPCPTPIIRPLASLRSVPSARRLVAVGASTGGTEALRELLTALPADAPPMLVVQHMPEQFTRAFANRLNDLSAVQVREAADGDRVLDGCVLVAPGNRHMRLARDGATLLVRLSDDPPVNRHRPSVDVLFESCAAVVGAPRDGLALGAAALEDRGQLALQRLLALARFAQLALVTLLELGRTLDADGERLLGIGDARGPGGVVGPAVAPVERQQGRLAEHGADDRRDGRAVRDARRGATDEPADLGAHVADRGQCGGREVGGRMGAGGRVGFRRALGSVRPGLRVAVLLLHRHDRRIMSAESSAKLNRIDRVSVG